MVLYYRSTRSEQTQNLTASEAILQGLAPDNGLYVPTQMPQLKEDLATLLAKDYPAMAFSILKVFLDDFSDDDLQACIDAAYQDTFDTADITPIRSVGPHHFLELFHGPTLAFKDVALQLLPQLMVTAMKMHASDKKVAILTATSGDTGKAAMAGFADVPNTKIIVFYPQAGVSPIQKQQMITQVGQNVTVVGIDGNFDDAQTNVKHILNDNMIVKKLARNHIQFSSANSINIGRLVPQIVYYFNAYGQLVQNGTVKLGETVDFSVPTGNFGDILAGWYAKQLGLPINKLICASNANNVLTDFFTTGVYNRKRDFHLTSSPSMDILVSSNLERLLFYSFDQDAAALAKFMTTFETKGRAELPDTARQKLTDFVAFSTDEVDTLTTIRLMQTKYQYTIDPHTAVATHAAIQYSQEHKSEARPLIILSTANPYKFPEVVLHALTNHQPSETDFAAIQALSNLIELPVPKAIRRLKHAKVLHEQTIPVAKMSDLVLNTLSEDKSKSKDVKN
ncbi:threonine synthase [Lactobacillus sp. CC-MHH1034]|uniref:threonine synthase n=1 Tax=Agrilactobacillus fermenti TaxID=2586909 RepID=UPI001E5DDC4F|nr:threonine synthase [Agrilactobacillus fermenti]MCD2255833.1 threonine synthase [Agrilactobacillus fermenti]